MVLVGFGWKGKEEGRKGMGEVKWLMWDERKWVSFFDFG
jgi:hypothetical protein